jgi:hypothetical protein
MNEEHRRTIERIAALQVAELRLQFNAARQVLGARHENVAALKAQLDRAEAALEAFRADQSRAA